MVQSINNTFDVVIVSWKDSIASKKTSIRFLSLESPINEIFNFSEFFNFISKHSAISSPSYCLNGQLINGIFP